MKRYTLILSVILAAAGPAAAGQAGAQFLRIDTDARLSGMGSAGAATAYGISALNYNPAGLSSMKGAEVAFSHSKWLMDSSHDFAGFGTGVGALAGKKLTLGVGLTRLSNTSMDARAEDRSSSGDFDAYDQAVSLGFAAGDVGLAVKYVQSSIAGVRAGTFAADFGARHRLSGLPVTLGFGVQNLGRGLKYLSQRDHLPLSVSAGISAALLPGVGLVLDVKRLVYDKETVVSAGTEYSMLMGGVGFSLRGGYGLAGVLATDGGNAVSAGAGVKALGAELDYAVAPETALGSVQRITLKKRF